LAADPAWRDQALKPLAELAREKNLTIVAGVVLVKPLAQRGLSFLPDGSQRSYDKRHLLLPGEDKFTPGPARTTGQWTVGRHLQGPRFSPHPARRRPESGR